MGDEGKLRLLGEVKNRAKGAFQQKDMPSAEALYGKAIKILDTMPDKREAVLYSNRAMVRLNLSKSEDALFDTKKCIELDPSNVKAWHRQAQALTRMGEWEEAIKSATRGAELDPDNKAFPEIIEKAEQARAKDAEDKAKLKTDAQDVRVELHNASTARVPPKKAREGDNEANEMRGYKKTADGKTTSYFHTEISEEAKRLIEEQGFGKPKKIDAPLPEVEVKGGASQWNQAGTYEEKNMMRWAEDRFRCALTGISFDIPTGSAGNIVTTNVSEVTGDASISASRGKRRRIMDLSMVVEYEAKVGDSEGRGKLCISEVSADDDEFELKVDISAETPPAIREVINAFVKPAGQGLQPLVMAQIKKVVEEYVQL